MLKELNQVMDYIETHLTEEIALESLSEYAGVSDYHFRKVFFYLAGMRLSEYIRNRRLSEAGMDLLLGETVTEVAFKYAYQSVDGFTRAFKEWSGFLPSEVKQNGAGKTFRKLSFVITVNGGNSMEFRIEKKPAFCFAGVSKRVPMQFEGVNNEIVKLAQSITAKQREEMHTLHNIDPKEIVNVSYDADENFLKEEGYLTHMIGVLTTEKHVSDQLDKIQVEPCTWAVFPTEGPFPSTLQNTMAGVYSEWLPSSNYELLTVPSFSFTRMDPEKKEYAYSEVWIPVREK